MNDCIEWSKARSSGGYGTAWDAERGRTIPAHRLAWERVHGPIPDGLWVLHRCDNPPCVNVEHLFLGTHADNMADMVAKGRGRNHPRYGLDNPAAKLAPEARQSVVDLYLIEGVPQTALARWFGISQSRISQLVTRARRTMS